MAYPYLHVSSVSTTERAVSGAVAFLVVMVPTGLRWWDHPEVWQAGVVSEIVGCLFNAYFGGVLLVYNLIGPANRVGRHFLVTFFSQFASLSVRSGGFRSDPDMLLSDRFLYWFGWLPFLGSLLVGIVYYTIAGEIRWTATTDSLLLAAGVPLIVWALISMRPRSQAQRHQANEPDPHRDDSADADPRVRCTDTVHTHAQRSSPVLVGHGQAGLQPPRARSHGALRSFAGKGDLKWWINSDILMGMGLFGIFASVWLVHLMFGYNIFAMGFTSSTDEPFVARVVPWLALGALLIAGRGYWLHLRLRRFGIEVVGRIENVGPCIENGYGDVTVAFSYRGAIYSVKTSLPQQVITTLEQRGPVRLLIDPDKPVRHVVMYP